MMLHRRVVVLVLVLILLPRVQPCADKQYGEGCAGDSLRFFSFDFSI
jgi:hypothetical protein